MAMTPEKKVKQKVVEVLKAAGAYYFYPVTGGYGSSGVFDIVVCHHGIFIGIECKAGKGKTTKLQSRNARLAKASGGVVLVIDETNIDYAKYVLDEVSDIANDETKKLSGLSFWPSESITS